MKHFLLLLISVAVVIPSICSAQTVSIKGDATKGKAIATTVCNVCHGLDGNSIGPPYPKLASQYPEYLFRQMKQFKPANGKPPERANPTMMIMLAAFDEAQMRDLTAYYASQKLIGYQQKVPDSNKAGQKKVPDSNKAGQKLYRLGNATKSLPACAACHGPTGKGIPNLFPRIDGQEPQYVEIQLKAYRAETRTNDHNKMMRMVAAKMSDAEIKAVASYVAELR